MATRLPVVIALSNEFRGAPGIRGATGDFVADLATRLFGESSCDVNVIRPLTALSQEGTDRLFLEGLSGDFVLVVAETPEVVAAELERLNLLDRPSGGLLPVLQSGSRTPRNPRLVCVSGDEPVEGLVRRILQTIRQPGPESRLLPPRGSLPTAVKAEGSSGPTPPISLAAPAIPVENHRQPPGNHETLNQEPWLESLVDQLAELDL